MYTHTQSAETLRGISFLPLILSVTVQVASAQVRAQRERSIDAVCKHKTEILKLLHSRQTLFLFKRAHRASASDFQQPCFFTLWGWRVFTLLKRTFFDLLDVVWLVPSKNLDANLHFVNSLQVLCEALNPAPMWTTACLSKKKIGNEINKRRYQAGGFMQQWWLGGTGRAVSSNDDSETSRWWKDS